jgi:hypothetical protein
MAYRRIRKFPLLIVAVALGSVLSTAPAQASSPYMGHTTGTVLRCYWRHVPGHWVWVNGRRTWVPPRSVRVCR